MDDTLEDWGWDADWQRSFEAASHFPAVPGRITEHHRDRWVAQTAVGPNPARLTRSDGPTLHPTAGDWVVVEPGPSDVDPWAVLGAEAKGTLPSERLASFQKLKAEAAYERRKADPQARAKQVADMKAAIKSLKQHHPKYQDRQ